MGDQLSVEPLASTQVRADAGTQLPKLIAWRRCQRGRLALLRLVALCDFDRGGLVPLYDYFRAAGRNQALAIALRPGGPLGREGVAAQVDGLALKNLDPFAVMGQLLALILDVDWSTGLYRSVTVWPSDPQPRDWSDVSEDSPWVTGPWVEDLGVAFRDAFAAADDSRIPEISEKWQSIEELRGFNPSAWAYECVESFVALNRRARDAGQSVYCWACL